MIVSFHNFYSIWEAFGEALGSFQEARRPTFGLKTEVRRQVPLVLRAISKDQAPHRLSNAPPWYQNKLKIILKFIPILFRIEILAQTKPEVVRKSIQDRSNIITHGCLAFTLVFYDFLITFPLTVQSFEPSKSLKNQWFLHVFAPSASAYKW